MASKVIDYGIKLTGANQVITDMKAIGMSQDQIAKKQRELQSVGGKVDPASIAKQYGMSPSTISKFFPNNSLGGSESNSNSGVIKGLKKSLGTEESGFGGSMKMLQGAGALVGFKIAGDMALALTENALPLIESYKQGKIAFSELVGSVVKTLPIFGDFYKAGENLRAWWDDSVGKPKKEAATNELKTASTKELIKSLTGTKAEDVKKSYDLRDRQSLIGLTGDALSNRQQDNGFNKERFSINTKLGEDKAAILASVEKQKEDAIKVATEKGLSDSQQKEVLDQIEKDGQSAIAAKVVLAKKEIDAIDGIQKTSTAERNKVQSEEWNKKLAEEETHREEKKKILKQESQDRIASLQESGLNGLNALASAGDKVSLVEKERWENAKRLTTEYQKLKAIIDSPTADASQKAEAQRQLGAIQGREQALVGFGLKGQRKTLLDAQVAAGGADSAGAANELNATGIKDDFAQSMAEAQMIMNNPNATDAQKAQAVATLKGIGATAGKRMRNSQLDMTQTGLVTSENSLTSQGIADKYNDANNPVIKAMEISKETLEVQKDTLAKLDKFLTDNAAVMQLIAAATGR